MNYILDTNVISELVTVRPNAKVTDWIEAIDPELVYLSVITIGELKKGIEKLPNSARKTQLDSWLQEDLLVRFEDHILNVDAGTMQVWGSLSARLESIGRPISAMDSLLAATALQRQYTLVTRNSADFSETGVSLLNPWE
jgi:toxin FitB